MTTKHARTATAATGTQTTEMRVVLNATGPARKERNEVKRHTILLSDEMTATVERLAARQTNGNFSAMVRWSLDVGLMPTDYEFYRQRLEARMVRKETEETSCGSK